MKTVLLESRNRSDRIQMPDINKDISVHDTIRKTLHYVERSK